MQHCQSQSERMRAWSRAVREACGPYETELSLSCAKFVGQVSADLRGGLPFALLRTNAGRVRRATSFRESIDPQHFVLLRQSVGRAKVTHGGFAYHLAPGDLVLLDSSGECEIEPDGLIEYRVISLPKADVFRTVEQPSKGIVHVDPVCGRLLGVLMHELSEKTTRASVAEEKGLLDAILALLGPSRSRQRTLVEGNSRRLAVGIRQQAEILIRDCIRNPGLNPASVANALNVSLRQLYRAFEDRGDSVYGFILKQRLSESANELTSVEHSSRSITDIAFRCGFSDAATFSRSFRRIYGVSPSEYRSSAGA